MKGFTLIELLVIIATICLLGSIFVDIGNKKEEKPQTEQEYCQTFENWSVNKLPVKCLKYFQTNGSTLH